MLVPDKSKTIQDIALMANLAWNMPAGVEAGLEASMFYDPPNFVYPFGSHVAVVEVDAETGQIDLKRYVALDDCGPQINPVIVEGQVHGGVVQGIGQALWEEAVYDDAGQLLTGSMLDYALPTGDAARRGRRYADQMVTRRTRIRAVGSQRAVPERRVRDQRLLVRIVVVGRAE